MKKVLYWDIGTERYISKDGTTVLKRESNVDKNNVFNEGIWTLREDGYFIDNKWFRSELERLHNLEIV